MPGHAASSPKEGSPSEQDARASVKQRRNIFEVPAPLKRIFDRFPLATYDANELPQRAPRDRNKAVLYVFSSPEDAKQGRPSFNPGCLKWQTYLKIHSVEFRIASSNNHASPSGALPYLQLAVTRPESSDASDLIPSSKIKRWIVTQKGGKDREDTLDERRDTYEALVDSRIRKAWLYQLYLAPQNTSLVQQLYIKPCSTNALVQMATFSQLYSAAETELVKSCKSEVISAVDLIQDAEEAFFALSALLGEHRWFFGHSQPGLLDAGLFAYTHLILDESLPWRNNPLGECLAKHQNLVQHADRIRNMYY